MGSTPLQPRIETRPAFTVVGLTARGTPDGIDYMALWEEFAKVEASVEDLAVSDEVFGVQYDMDDQTGEFTYLAGIAVDAEADDADIPDELTSVDVPERRYAVFETTLETVGETMDAIYGEWFPQSGHEHAESPEFERYGLEFDPETNPGFEVWIPLVES